MLALDGIVVNYHALAALCAGQNPITHYQDAELTPGPV